MDVVGWKRLMDESSGRSKDVEEGREVRRSEVSQRRCWRTGS